MHRRVAFFQGGTGNYKYNVYNNRTTPKFQYDQRTGRDKITIENPCFPPPIHNAYKNPSDSLTENILRFCEEGEPNVYDVFGVDSSWFGIPPGSTSGVIVDILLKGGQRVLPEILSKLKKK